MARFTLPRDLYHGKGSLEALKTFVGKRAMICVGGGSMKRFGFLDRAIGYLKEAGMEHIFVVGNKAFQRQAAARLGVPADCYCDAGGDVQGWIAERTGGAGADVFFECVGKQETVSLSVDGTAPGGRIVLVGNPASDMTLERDCYWKILRSQLSVTGTWNTTFTHEPDDDWHYVRKRLQERRIDPAALITHTFPPEEAGYGFALMRDKTEEYGKVMIIFS